MHDRQKKANYPHLIRLVPLGWYLSVEAIRWKLRLDELWLQLPKCFIFPTAQKAWVNRWHSFLAFRNAVALILSRCHILGMMKRWIAANLNSGLNANTLGNCMKPSFLSHPQLEVDIRADCVLWALETTGLGGQYWIQNLWVNRLVKPQLAKRYEFGYITEDHFNQGGGYPTGMRKSWFGNWTSLTNRF